jgi:protein-tyrosine-phosphatase
VNPNPGPAIELFAADGQDVSDPFGGSHAVYAACADELERHASYQAEQLCPLD